ncbi:tetratricopeptide repeat protein [Microbacterium sp. ZW T6_19]|uniref:tetratricopeptide repeat protein n=1 Tax=Microbacterium sp. ZW T6_19 TaxID=3378082 RepID=UPI0038553B72
MARPKKRFPQLLEEIDRTPWGPAEQALVAEAVALALEIGDEQLEYQARMRQTASANMGGATDVMLNSFAWCLAHHDADPQRFPADLDNGGADLMWQFKWMASALRSSPAFSGEQISAVLDDMESHYRAAGLGLSGVLTARFEDAWDAGRIDDAEALRVQLEATPRDEHSHCDACGRSQFAGFFADTDRDADAIRLVEEMIEGGFSCGEEPEHALSRVLLPYLRAGRFDEAKSAHLRSYRLAKDNPDNLRIVANNIVFTALTGNEARALALIERHISWLAHDGLNVDAHFAALSAFAVALDRVTATGHGSTPVRGADAADLVSLFGEHDGPWSAEDLAGACWDAAERIGAAFDERDGTSGHARSLERMRALASEQYDVPIRSDAFVAAPAASVPLDADGWFQRASDLAQYGAEKETLAALPRALEVDDPAKRAQLQSMRIGILVALDRAEEAAELLSARIGALREAGLEAQADLESRLGLATFGLNTPEAAEMLEQELTASDSLPAWSRGDLALSRASLHLMADEPGAALDLVEHAARHFTEAADARLVNTTTLVALSSLLSAGDVDAASALLDRFIEQDDLSTGHRARALSMRARVRGGGDRFAEGATDADEACRLLAGLGATSALASTHLLAGALWEDAGDPEQAVARYRVAARFAEQDGDDATAVNFRLARGMLAAGDAEEAAELFGTVLDQEEQSEVPAGSRAMTASMLARALTASGEFGQAVGAYGYAAELFGEAEQHADHALALLERAKILARFDEHEDAIEMLESAADAVRKDPEAVGTLADVLHNLGQAYGGQGDERAFALFDEVAALAQQHDAGWLLADVTDSRGRALGALGRIDEAVAAALTAADGFSALGDEGSAGGSELYAARLLSGSEREADAVPVYRAALDRAAQFPPLREVAALELGTVLESLGRHGEAAEVRALLD